MTVPSKVVMILILCMAVPLAGSAHAGVLYDGGLGTLPSAQGWLYLANPPSGATQTLGAGAVTLDTTGQASYQAGYFSTSHPGVPTLDRHAGYRVGFDVQVTEEAHGSNDRAGFSVIALSEDKLGIELAFWENEIWAQSGPAFTHAEETGYDTTAVRRYELHVAGDRYSLSAGGSEILAGPLRDYSSHPYPVYSLTSFLFFGDDTTSAQASIALARIDVTAPTLIPEPAGLAFVALAGCALGRRTRRR